MNAPRLKIVSGGQSGVDRAALDFAIAGGYPHGGWCPRGRRAEDGAIAARYALNETASAGYRERTRRNVLDSDATLILNTGNLADGSLLTLRIAEREGKPVHVVALDAASRHRQLSQVSDWLRTHRIGVLNVAGPRESKRPGIRTRALALLQALEPIFQAMPQEVSHEQEHA